jgi:hypothetical protein
MDSVRFGRALGVGARAAAKTLVTAVDAATAPNPSAPKPQPTQASTASQAAPRGEQSMRPSGTGVVQQAAQRATQARQTGQGLVRGSRRFGEAVWKPFIKLSGVLGLELAGVFFGLFACFGAAWAWKLRGDLHETATNHDAHARFLVCVMMAAVFTYFLVSSFVRAHRRGRGR